MTQNHSYLLWVKTVQQALQLKNKMSLARIVSNHQQIRMRSSRKRAVKPRIVMASSSACKPTQAIAEVVVTPVSPIKNVSIANVKLSQMRTSITTQPRIPILTRIPIPILTRIPIPILTQIPIPILTQPPIRFRIPVAERYAVAAVWIPA